MHLRASTVARRSGKVLVLAALGAGSVVVAAGPTMASGQSPSTYGCYGKWWNTATAAYCMPAQSTGNYEFQAQCSHGSYSGSWFQFYANTQHEAWDRHECAFSVKRSWVVFTLG